MHEATKAACLESLELCTLGVREEAERLAPLELLDSRAHLVHLRLQRRLHASIPAHAPVSCAPPSKRNEHGCCA